MQTFSKVKSEYNSNQNIDMVIVARTQKAKSRAIIYSSTTK